VTHHGLLAIAGSPPAGVADGDDLPDRRQHDSVARTTATPRPSWVRSIASASSQAVSDSIWKLRPLADVDGRRSSTRALVGSVSMSPVRRAGRADRQLREDVRHARVAGPPSLRSQRRTSAAVAPVASSAVCARTRHEAAKSAACGVSWTSDSACHCTPSAKCCPSVSDGLDDAVRRPGTACSPGPTRSMPGGGRS
jgi:hypothetical protein